MIITIITINYDRYHQIWRVVYNSINNHDEDNDNNDS